MSGNHLPAVGSLYEYDGESEFGTVINFWYSAPGDNCCIAENAHLNIQSANGEAVTANGLDVHWHALDTSNYNLNLYHFAWSLSKPTSNVLFWIVTTVDSPRDIPNVRLAIGSNAASRWWLNGDPVIAINDDRQTVIDDGVSPRVTLHRGRNVIRAAVINGGGATDFCARFLDEKDQPLAGLSVSLEPAP